MSASSPQTAPSRPAFVSGREDVARRLEAASFATLAVLPFGMALLNKSAPAIVVAAALLAGLARVADRRLGAALARGGRVLRRPTALLLLVLVAYAGLSLGWSAIPRLSLHALGEAGLAAGACLVLHLCLPGRIPGWAVRLAAAATALGCLTIVAELSTGLWLRQQLGLRSAPFIFKRSVTCAALLFWPLAAALAARGRGALAVGLAVLLAIAVVAAHSGAALLGLLAGLVLLAAGWWLPRFGAGLTGLGLIAALAGAPLLGTVAAARFSPALLDRMERVQMRDRIAIWQSFGEVVGLRPLAGIGFGTSPAADRDPVAASVSAEHRPMLAVGHPHNGFLQVWTELGLLGAIGTGALLLLVTERTLRAPDRPAFRQACLAYGMAVMLVGHGAWQGWWIATIGVAALWFARGERPEPSPAPAPRP